MDPKIVVRATGDFRRLNSDLAKTESGFGRVGKRIKVGLAGAAVAGTAALVKLASSSVGAASASQQSLGATETVFGKYADTVIRKSRQAAEAVGLSANEYRELANVTGAMLQNAGTPIAKVTTLTEKLTKRAADMAATYGGSTKDAIEAVNSLLRGEADPIERYGVSIKQADINARLAAKGLDKLEGSAKKQAEQQARLELLFGQTSKAAGQFGRESDTIAGKGQRLSAKVEDLEAKFGDLLIPALVAGADVADEHLIPALEDLVGWLEANKGEFADMAGTVKDSVLPALSGAVDLGKAAVDIYSELPGPVKELATQAGLAALVLPRLAGGVTAVTAGAGSMISNLRNAEKRTAALGSAVRGVAGVGGLVALTQGATSSNDAVKTLGTTAGAAALGFSMAGPWGGAIGAVGGLASNFRLATDASDVSRKALTDYKSTLDATTGSLTEATREMVRHRLVESGRMKDLQDLGLNERQVINALIGQKGARKALLETIAAEQAAVEKLDITRKSESNSILGNLSAVKAGEKNARLQSLDAIRAELGAVDDAVVAKRREIQATQDLSGLIGKLPKRTVTKIEASGIEPTLQGVAKVAKQYGLTPKQIRSVIAVTGVEATVAEVRKAKQGLEDVGNAKPSNRWQKDLEADLVGAGMNVRRRRDSINALLGGTGKNARPNLGPFNSSLQAALNHARGIASSGGQGVGSALGAGVAGGIGSWMGRISNAASSAVSFAVRAARRAGKVESPSKETRYIGEMLGAGLEDGINAREKRIRAAARRVVNGMISEGREGVNEFLGDMSSFVKQDVNLKNDKKERRREKRILKSLKDEYAALRANAKAQDENTKKLDAARESLKALREEYSAYAAAIASTIAATGDITQLGRQDDGTVSTTSLLTDLRNKVNEAKRFADLIRQLQGQGLSRTAIQQMLDAGPEAALATAEAIAYGGAESIAEINKLQAELADTGATLGGKMADKYYGAGVQAAQGIVAGLTAEAKNLDKAAIKLANKLVKAVKKALGIKSPSREFMGIGDQVTKGLVIGLDNTYVKSAGVKLADSLVDGFKAPKLRADVLSTGGAAASAQTLTVRLTAEEASLLQQGREIQMKLDYARSNGVRGATF